MADIAAVQLSSSASVASEFPSGRSRVLMDWLKHPARSDSPSQHFHHLGITRNVHRLNQIG